MTSHSCPLRRDEFEIAIVCALPLEYDAAALVFDEFWDEDGDKFGRAKGDFNNYTTGRIGPYNVVLVLLPNMGKTSASDSTATLRLSYTRLRLAILVGICGGVPTSGTGEEILLGDVIISKSVVQYDLGQRYPDRFVRNDDIYSDLGRANKEIRALLATLETQRGRDRLKKRAAECLTQLQKDVTESTERTKYTYLGAKEDRLFKPSYIHKHRDGRGCGCNESGACNLAIYASCEELQCDFGLVEYRERLNEKATLEQEGDITKAQQPRIFIGCVGSGDTVMKSGEHRDSIAKEHGIIAFEMEGAGMWDNVPCIVIKGVCDYADSHKHKKWQDFAAATAASTAKALVERYTQTDKPNAAAGALPDPSRHANFYNSGSGHQYNNVGHDNQNNNTGAGKQYFANTMTFS
ncbi:pfs domain-containing protein [Ilyonectria destructans]|nr:pfs domain-containing protein [Ilyonectria destructans]